MHIAVAHPFKYANMEFKFKKNIQFSLVLKAGDKLREFNFNIRKGPEDEYFEVNVSDERGERIFFRMDKKESGWKILPAQYPSWLIQNESMLSKAMEEELSHW